MKTETYGVWRYLYVLIGKNLGFFLIRVLLGGAGVMSGLFFIMSFRRAVDIAVHSAGGNLMIYLLLMAFCIIGGILFSSLSSWLGSRKYVSVGNTLRSEMMTQIMMQEWSESVKMHTGDILNRLDKDISEISGFVTKTLPVAAITVFQFIVYSVYFFMLDYLLAIILIMLIPFGYILFRRYSGMILQANHNLRKAESCVMTSAEESLRGRTIVKSLSVEKVRMQDFERVQNHYTSCFDRRTVVGVLGSIMLKGGSGLCFLLVFVWGVLKLNNGGITFGTLTAFMQLVSRIQRPAVDLSRLSSSVVSVRTSVERILELYSSGSEMNVAPLLLNGSIGIKARSVSYSYSGSDRKVIENLNFDLKPGGSLAILGETGVGKTTLARLLLSLVKPDSGDILFYNDDFSVPASSSVRCNISYVPQGFSLFAGTLRENLLAVNPDVSEDEMISALRCASADFVFMEGAGLDMMVGESGNGLSEGQAQRIAIARALLSRGGIMLFDEATSALDEATEIGIVENIMRVYTRHTKIFITHSRAVAEKCDRFLLLDK